MVDVRSPLAHRAAALATIDAVEIPLLTQVDVRCSEADAVRLGFPIEPNTVTGDMTRGALWLGPDEWLVVAPPGDPGVIVEGLEALLVDTHHAVVDVSGNRALIELRGPNRLALLASACSLDLDPAGGWAPGVCAQTLLARAQVILQELPDATRVFVRPSFADYVVDRLVAAVR
ncbi:MAG TPA: sarcosine oxidase subunit gamma family protein [Actinomycetota bacterium]|jgi:sarcosine oxidase subunit gamma|nr:sarcosine oxidase subunit gamma family protein [Actinomycetota bacterium]